MSDQVFRAKSAATPSGDTSASTVRAPPFSQINTLLNEAKAAAQGVDNTALGSIIEAANQVSHAGEKCARELLELLRAASANLKREGVLVRQLKQLVRAMADQDAPAGIATGNSSPEIATNAGLRTDKSSALSRFERAVKALTKIMELASPEQGVDSDDASEARSDSTPALETFSDGWDAGHTTTESRLARRSTVARSHRTSVARSPERNAPTPPVMTVYFLSSSFQVLIDDKPVTEWPNQKGKSILRYLIAHRKKPVPKEVLMETFWAHAEQGAARNNLNVAIYSLRRTLGIGASSFPFVLFEDGCYLLNPHLQIWVDAEAFSEHIRRGRDCERGKRREVAAKEYRAAESLFQPELLNKERSDRWLDEIRQFHLKGYSHALDFLSRYALERNDPDTCISYCEKALALDACNEEAHRRLMQCHSRRGDIHLAIRQYHICTEILQRELNVLPSPITVDLGRRIRQRQPI
ncbi:MAG: BTAD domain-containing putative transcriptional regulator [Burkholderiales bacterium]